jgi:hypothetical protein
MVARSEASASAPLAIDRLSNLSTGRLGNRPSLVRLALVRLEEANGRGHSVLPQDAPMEHEKPPMEASRKQPGGLPMTPQEFVGKWRHTSRRGHSAAEEPSTNLAHGKLDGVVLDDAILEQLLAVHVERAADQEKTRK